MFTGIVTAVGRVERIDRSDASMRLRIEAPYDDLVIGESVAVNGACLTVVMCEGRSFAVDAVVTTRGRTRFDEMVVGDSVNLERALAVGQRLGGHFVQGHVDGVGEVLEVVRRHDAVLIDLRLPAEVAELSVPHGSIAIDGVSMTINARSAPDCIQLSVIPHTVEHTTLGALRAGSRVHVEGDMLGKFVRELLQRER